MTSRRFRAALRKPAQGAPAPPRASHGDQPAEPSSLPAQIGSLNLIAFSLIVADLGALGGLAGQAAGAVAGDVAPMVGGFLGIVYGCFPLQFLDGRAMLALAGYRILLWAVLVLHIPLVVALLLDFRAGLSGATETLFLTAPISIFLTPGLYLIADALRGMRWLDPAAPVDTWEAMPGIDGTPWTHPDQPPPRTTAAGIALLLPFIAAWRSRQPGLAGCAALLWLGAILLAAFAPWRAILMFCLAAGIGQRCAASAARSASAPPAKILNAAERRATLAGIFTQAQLAPAPAFAAAGLLALPWLFIIDGTALSAFLALPDCNSVAALLALLQTRDFILLVLLAVIFIPGMFFLPLGTPAAKLTFRAAALLLGLGELGLAGLYAAISFHLSFGVLDIYVPAPVYAVFWPITVGLLACTPLAVIAGLAVITFGGVADLLRD
jgi:hypothetical protein